MAQVLIIDDERHLCTLLTALLAERGHKARSIHAGEAAVSTVLEDRPDLVLLDLHLGGIDGLEVLRRLLREVPGLPVVMITAYGNVDAAVGAMRLGALDFITKPFDNRKLLDTIDRLLALRAGRHHGDKSGPVLVGRSPAFRAAFDLAARFAVPDINVLLLGETGTGKELFARTIHDRSKRSDRPFVAVDCSMLAENLIESELFGHEKGAFTGAASTHVGRFEQAQGGTIFLDEIGNLSLAFQAKLLRVLQMRQIERVGGRETIRLDVRVVSATNANLLDAIRRGTFREDLYFRLNEMTIRLPPLRDRAQDISAIATHFADRYAAQFGMPVAGIAPEAMGVLEAYPWPGNVRELESAMKAAVVLADGQILPEHLPEQIRTGARGGDASAAEVPVTVTHGEHDEERLRVEMEFGIDGATLDLKALGNRAAEEAERTLLAALISRKHCTGTELARLLNVDPKTLRAKLRKFGLQTAES